MLALLFLPVLASALHKRHHAPATHHKQDLTAMDVVVISASDPATSASAKDLALPAMLSRDDPSFRTAFGSWEDVHSCMDSLSPILIIGDSYQQNMFIEVRC